MKIQAKNNSSVTFHNPVIQRILLFILAFVVISGLTGSWVISTQKLLFPFYFAIYGSAGKSFLFGLLAFVLLAKNRLLNIKTEKLSLSHLLYALTSVLCVIGFFLAGQQLLSYTAASQVPLLTFAAHVLLLA
jgi:hypothetical protein